MKDQLQCLAASCSQPCAQLMLCIGSCPAQHGKVRAANGQAHGRRAGNGAGTFLSLMGALVSIIWQAVCSPTRRGRRCVPPKPGRMPSCSSGRPSFVPAPQHPSESALTLLGMPGQGPASCLNADTPAINYPDHLPSLAPNPLMSLCECMKTQLGHQPHQIWFCMDRQMDRGAHRGCTGARCRQAQPLGRRPVQASPLLPLWA